MLQINSPWIFVYVLPSNFYLYIFFHVFLAMMSDSLFSFWRISNADVYKRLWKTWGQDGISTSNFVIHVWTWKPTAAQFSDVARGITIISNYLEVTISIVLPFSKLQMQMSFITCAMQKAIVDMGLEKSLGTVASQTDTPQQKSGVLRCSKQHSADSKGTSICKLKSVYSCS